MAAYTRNRTINWIIVILVIMNLALLVTIWYPRINPPPKETVQSQEPVKKGASVPVRENQFERRERLASFLERELGFSQEQVEKFFQLREKHFQKSQELKRQIDDLRKEMMDQLLVEKPDTARVEELAAALGQKVAEHEKSVYNHFIDLMAVCNAEQEVKYRGLMRDILDQLAPPGERRPGERQPGGHQPPPRERDINRGKSETPPVGDSRDRQFRSEPSRPGEDSAPSGQPGEQFRQGSRPGMQGVPPQKRRPGEAGPGQQNRQGSPGGMNAEHHLRMLRYELSLTDAQVEKIRPILESAMKKMEQISRDSRYRSHEERRQARDKVHQWEDSQVEAILTSEQKKRYQEIKKRRPPSRG